MKINCIGIEPTQFNEEWLYASLFAGGKYASLNNLAFVYFVTHTESILRKSTKEALRQGFRAVQI